MSYGFVQLPATTMTGLWLVTPLHAVSLEWCSPCQSNSCALCRQLSGWLTIGHICTINVSISISLYLKSMSWLDGTSSFSLVTISIKAPKFSWFSVHGLGCCVQCNNLPYHEVQDLLVPNIDRYQVYICSYAISNNAIYQVYACHMPFLIIYHMLLSYAIPSNAIYQVCCWHMTFLILYRFCAHIQVVKLICRESRSETTRQA